MTYVLHEHDTEGRKAFPGLQIADMYFKVAHSSRPKEVRSDMYRVWVAGATLILHGGLNHESQHVTYNAKALIGSEYIAIAKQRTSIWNTNACKSVSCRHSILVTYIRNYCPVGVGMALVHRDVA